MPMTIRFCFVDGSWMDSVEPADSGFSFTALVQQLRTNHYLVCDSFYIPEPMIKLILRGDPNQMRINMPRQTAPTSSTKQ